MTCVASHSLHVIVALEHTYLHLACRTDHNMWFWLVCMNWFMSYRFSRKGHVRWLRLTYHIIFIHHLAYIFIIEIFDMAHTLVSLLSSLISIYVCIIIFWKIIQVLQWGVSMFIKTTVFLKALFLPTHVFCFSPLQVLAVESSYQREFLMNHSIGSYLWG